MRILIIKNGICDTDVDRLLREIECTVNCVVTCSKSIDYDTLNIMNYNGVIILGGAQRLSDMIEIKRKHSYLIDLISHIKKWIELDINILGICLGAQLIAIALGHDVVKCDIPVCGYNKKMELTNDSADDTLFDFDFELFNPYFLSLHNDQIVIKNDNLKVLVESDKIPYAFKRRNTYGVQFHPDITLNVLQTFCDEFDFDQSLIEEGMEFSNRSRTSSMIFFMHWLSVLQQRASVSN